MRSGLHSLRLGSSHMVPWLEPDPETASTPGTQGRRRNGQTLYSLWAITDANFIRLSCLITACQRCSLMTLLAPGCGIHYCVPGPGPAWGSALEAAASGHELGCPLAPAVMAWTWAQSQLRLRAQSHDTRARAHWPGLLTGIMCLLLALTTGTQALCANMG